MDQTLTGSYQPFADSERLENLDHRWAWLPDVGSWLLVWQLYNGSKLCIERLQVAIRWGCLHVKNWWCRYFQFSSSTFRILHTPYNLHHFGFFFYIQWTWQFLMYILCHCSTETEWKLLKKSFKEFKKTSTSQNVLVYEGNEGCRKSSILGYISNILEKKTKKKKKYKNHRCVLQIISLSLKSQQDLVDVRSLIMP